MTGPRDDETWRKVAGTAARPGWSYFAIVAVASLILGLVLSAWALGLL